MIDGTRFAAAHGPLRPSSGLGSGPGSITGETAADQEAIRHINHAAFDGDNEAKLVDALSDGARQTARQTVTSIR